ncbi:ABC transporter ATP-binding protein [Alkalihalobacillus sp. MEB130]|uniref:ABC transporter ATP-binding protein n=1 Tax=Alkalihalobacillus sp. MEB130 TaxID=2976704 RepID=UPI0028DF126C|nr:ABC transporter ATP-binding protein [Alkalihalobacillus sp. MEB130]MDT8860548.1 ABC transporter ATP-binding protein [Alkalihalobacillus sp. MEB130]
MTKSIVLTKSLTKHYKKFTLGPIDFQIEEGTAVAIVGANGSGKSSFFRLLMNLLQPDEGSITLFDQSMNESEAEIKRKIGYSGGMLEPLGYLTVKEISSFFAYWYPTWDQEYYVNLINRYEIDTGMKFGKCSTGIKKRVEFIFSLSHHPTLLLLDEPSSGVDIVSQKKMKEDLIDFMEKGERSIVMATHSIDEVNSICDWITVFEKGQIIQSFNKDEIFEKWARVWVTDMTETIKQHPNFLELDVEPLQIVTNNWSEMEKELEKEGIAISHFQKMTLEEGLEYIISSESRNSIKKN